MKCESAKDAVLLKQSGELTAKQTDDLHSHLDDCADCRRYEAAVRHVTDAAGKALLSGMPSDAVMQRIIGSAKRTQPVKPVMLYLPALRLMAAAAAVLILITGGYFGLTVLDQRAVAARDSRASHVSTIVAMIAEGDSAADEANAAVEANVDLHVLADQLLRAEGLLGDEPQDQDYATPAEESQTRDLRSRSTFGFLPAECV